MWRKTVKQFMVFCCILRCFVAHFLFALYALFRGEQARKLQDAQAEKLTSLESNKLTS